VPIGKKSRKRGYIKRFSRLLSPKPAPISLPTKRFVPALAPLAVPLSHLFSQLPFHRHARVNGVNVFVEAPFGAAPIPCRETASGERFQKLVALNRRQVVDGQIYRRAIRFAVQNAILEVVALRARVVANRLADAVGADAGLVARSGVGRERARRHAERPLEAVKRDGRRQKCSHVPTTQTPPREKSGGKDENPDEPGATHERSLRASERIRENQERASPLAVDGDSPVFLPK